MGATVAGNKTESQIFMSESTVTLVNSYFEQSSILVTPPSSYCFESFAFYFPLEVISNPLNSTITI